MLLWPIINIFFVILVGYDSDLTKTIRKLQQKRWRPLSDVTTTIDLTEVPSFRPRSKRPLSTCHSDPQLQPPGHDAPSMEDSDMSSMHLGGCKKSPDRIRTSISPQLQAVTPTTITIIKDKHQSKRRMSIQNVAVGTASSDTDDTRVGYAIP